MKEYEYTIIRRESRNPKRNREGRGISQSDLDALRRELMEEQRVAGEASSEETEELTLTNVSLSKRLDDAEHALSGTLSVGSFDQWRNAVYENRQVAINQALARKQPAGNYASISQLTTSSQQAIAEAIKRAGEMDKQIKVGGRNLLRTGYFEKVYFRSDTDKLISYDDKDKKITYIGNGARWNSWIWLSDLEDVTTINLRKAIGEYTLSFSVRGRGTVSFEVIGNYKTNYSDYKTTVQTLTEDWQRVSCPFTRSAEDSSLFCLYNSKPETGDWVQFADDWKLERGTVATDWTPAPEDVAASITSVRLNTEKSLRGVANLQNYFKGLNQTVGETSATVSKLNDSWKEVDQRVVNLNNWAGKTAADVESFDQWRSQTAPMITDLDRRSLTIEQKQDLGYLTTSFQRFKGGDGGTLEGLTLQRYIALRGDNNTVSAYLAGDTLGAMLKAGVTGFGTMQEQERVAIYHNGTGHIGNLYFTGNQIDFRTDEDSDPYLSVGANANTNIDAFLRANNTDDVPIQESEVRLTNGRTVYNRSVEVTHDGTSLRVTIEDLVVETYRGATTRLTLDGDVLAEWRGSGRYVDNGAWSGGKLTYEDEPYKAQGLSYERTVSSGTHTLLIEIVSPNSGARATLRGFRVRRRFDSGRTQSVLTSSGLRLFGSAERYFDVDYRSQFLSEYTPYGRFPYPNPYTVRIKGGAKIDKLTLDGLDMPGVPLCGASFDENGTQIKAFGKYVKKRGSNRAQAVYDYGMAAYKVYHSIGNTNYIPIVQVSGWSSNNINWSLTPRVYNITSEYFVVRILTNNDNPQTKAISYVAFKTE